VAESIRIIRRTDNHSFRLALIVAGSCLLLGAAGYGVWRMLFPPVLLPHSIAIFRLKTATGTENEAALSLSIAGDLKDALTMSGKTDVIDAGSVAVENPLVQGWKVSTEAVLTGSVESAGANVRARLDLTRVSDGKPVWSGTFDGPSSNWFVIGDKAANDLISALLHEVPLVQHHTADPVADQLYWNGRVAMEQPTEASLKTAITRFQASTVKDPAHALAWAGLAEASRQLYAFNVPFRKELLSGARAAARRAVELDPAIAEPHTTLALIAVHNDWDWQDSERGLRRALDLNPHFAAAHDAYGQLLVMTGKPEAGLAELRTASHLDPLSPLIASDYTKCLFLAGRFDDAISTGRDSLERNPSLLMPHLWMAAAYSGKGMRDEQQAELKLAGPAQTADNDAFGQALAETSRGNKDKAFQLLDDAFANHSEGMISLKVDPRLEPLRSDTRFASLLRRMRLA
jgi:tetratricopeptide (TPR) repeat protein